MNFVAIARFFYIIYDAIFIFLFGADQSKKGLLGPIFYYFGTVKINNHRMLHLHYLVWLKNMLYLAILQMQL